MATSTTPRPNCAPLDDYILRQVQLRAAKLIGKSGLPPDQVEDLQQDMCLELLKARSRFNPDKSTWHTFASRVLDYFSRQFIRRQSARRRNDWRDHPCADFEDDFSLDDGARFDEELTRMMRGQSRQRLQKLLLGLPRELQELCEALVQNSNKRAVSRELGIGKSTLYRRIEILRKRFGTMKNEFPSQNRGTHWELTQM